MTRVDADPVTSALEGSLTESDCSPTVMNVTWSRAMPLTNVALPGSEASASLLETSSEPLKPRTTLPSASNAIN